MSGNGALMALEWIGLLALMDLLMEKGRNTRHVSPGH